MQADSRSLTQAIFVAKVLNREINTPGGEPAVVFNDLLKLVTGRFTGNPEALMTRINASSALRKQYAALVQTQGYAFSATCAAASNGHEFATRQNEQFSLRFKRDTLDARQIFALLQIFHPTERHNSEAVLVHVFNQHHCERLEFPALIAGTTQLLFDQADKQLQLLLDADAQISIMP